MGFVLEVLIFGVALQMIVIALVLHMTPFSLSPFTPQEHSTCGHN